MKPQRARQCVCVGVMSEYTKREDGVGEVSTLKLTLLAPGYKRRFHSVWLHYFGKAAVPLVGKETTSWHAPLRQKEDDGTRRIFRADRQSEPI